jgi:hypothetical protein
VTLLINVDDDHHDDDDDDDDDYDGESPLVNSFWAISCTSKSVCMLQSCSSNSCRQSLDSVNVGIACAQYHISRDTCDQSLQSIIFHCTLVEELFPSTKFLFNLWQDSTFSHHQQGRIDFNTVNPSLPMGKDLLIHSL